MSYTTGLRCIVKDGDREVANWRLKDPSLIDPTLNLGQMFRVAMCWDFDACVDYPVTEALPHIERGIEELTNNAESYRDFEAPNGYGTISEALAFLMALRKRILDAQDDVPIEYMYVYW